MRDVVPEASPGDRKGGEPIGLGAAAFDEEGFAKDGSHWVAFNYKPIPSSF